MYELLTRIRIMSIGYTVDETLCKDITRKHSNFFGFLCKNKKIKLFGEMVYFYSYNLFVCYKNKLLFVF